jgi:formylglycine-generating enzyme required for sulfatase activity
VPEDCIARAGIRRASGILAASGIRRASGILAASGIRRASGILAAELMLLPACGRTRLGTSSLAPFSDNATNRASNSTLNASTPNAMSDGGQAAWPPSCQPGGPGMTDCGIRPIGVGGESITHESCCTSLLVNGGSYARTYLHFGPEATAEADPATVTSFRLDKYMVTVGRFRQFVRAWKHGAGWTPPIGSGKHVHLNEGRGLASSAVAGTFEPGWVASDNVNLAPTSEDLACNVPTSPEGGSQRSYDTWTPEAAGQEHLPVTCLNWYEAMAFCIWDGGFLPSEAEWEYAAAGGSEQRKYPWGSAEPGSESQYAIYGCYYPVGGSGCTDVTSIAPPGSAPLGAGRWGQLDLAGDVWEWTLDAYEAYVNPCVDCARLGPAPTRILRGGDFGETTANLIPSHRYQNPPTARFYNFGLRCARTP